MGGEDVGAELDAAGGYAGDDGECLEAGVAHEEMASGGWGGGLAAAEEMGLCIVRGGREDAKC